jgi:hypothetical protein
MMLGRAGSGLATMTALVAFAFTLSACGGDDDDDDPGEERPFVAEPLSQTPGDWTQFVPVEVKLDDRTYSPTCSGAPGTDPSFHFWARRGSSDKLVVFFEGGGACWDGTSCAFPINPSAPAGTPQLYAASIGPDQDPRRLGGLFDLQNPENPVRDWSYVYVPYCTGDIHSGSATTSYVNPFTGENYAIQHRGADNFRVILEWIEQNFEEPDQFLVTGSSAGGYGAVTHFAGLRKAYPSAQGAMLSDAAQGVVPPTFDAVRNESWNLQPPEDVFGQDPQSIPSGQLLERLAQHFSNDRFAQYTTSLDLTQIGFYDAMVNGPQGTQGTACAEWSQAMRAELATRQQTPNFRSYVGAGIDHMILRGEHPDQAGDPLFFRETTAGAPFTEWFDAMLSESGQGWTNLSCTNCDTLPFACPL